MLGLLLLWVLWGWWWFDDVCVCFIVVLLFGVEMVIVIVVYIDIVVQVVYIDNSVIGYDVLVIVLGVVLNIDVVFGLLDVFDVDVVGQFYILDGVVELCVKVEVFGYGWIVVVIVGVLFKCLVVLFEVVFLIVV